MGSVIKDFYKSDAPQFKGRSKEKRREMAIAAKLEAERGPQKEEVQLEGIGDKLKGAVKAVKKGVEQERKFQRASSETVDRMKRMARHKQDKYGPSTLKQRLKTGAEHNIDNERKAKMKNEGMSPKEIMLQKKKAMIDQKIARDRKKQLNKAEPAEPTKAMGEGLSVDDQMKIYQDYNRMAPEEKKAANKKAMGSVKKVAPKKDTRTDAQKMTDATGPRPGSRYRGD